MLLADKVAIVTGGAKGIGRGICLKLAEEGCSIVIADLLGDRAAETAAEISTKGGKALAIKCSVTDSRQVNDMVAAAIDRFRKIDILVNDVGALPRHYPAEELPEEEWDKVIDINLKSQFLCCKAVIPHMKAKKYGKIVNLSSIGVRDAVGPDLHYVAAKFGVLGLTFDLAFELAPFNITVNAILPGPIPTDFWTTPATPEMLAGMARTIPMQRTGTPEDIAKAVLFFASDLSSWVTGENLLVAGGMPMKPNLPGTSPG
jgi:NAD(P)-dependent dehydrogenase (short-subunit alcohol dehydrogenase family)